MSRPPSNGPRVVCLVLFLTALGWSVLIALTGGVEWHVTPGLVVRSRSNHNPLIVALVTGLLSWFLFTDDEQRQGSLRLARTFFRGPIALAARIPRWVATVAVATASIWVVIVGIRSGAFVAANADAYGYVSQAHFWTMGTLRIDQPFVRDMHWRDADVTLAPLGYRPLEHSTAIVPMFPPGLPLVMSLFERVGGPGAVFYVVPLLGGLAVWATFWIGRQMAGRSAGTFAAVAMATSPPFLCQLMQPMTDVPVTAWWALSLALVLSRRRAATFGGGLAAGLAILTRLNLAPLAIVPGAWLVWQIARERARRRHAVQRLILFGAGLLPGCVAVAWINWSLYGSPWLTGLGTADAFFSWRYVLPNLATYPSWIMETETDIVALALLTPLLLMTRARACFSRNAAVIAVMLLAFAGAVLASYAFYLPHDNWVWVRYLLPAFPPLLVLMAVALLALLASLTRGVRTIAVVLVLALLVQHGYRFSRDVGVFTTRQESQGPRAVGEYIAGHLPNRAIFISMLHSGSTRLYAGRLTVRYDVMPPGELDRAVSELRRLGYRPYLVLDAGEEILFRERFAGFSALSALDWPPVAQMANVARIYDPAERGLATPPRPRPDVIP